MPAKVLFPLALLLFTAFSASADEPKFHWRFTETLKDGKLDKSWNDPGILGRNKRAEVTVDPSYTQLSESLVTEIKGKKPVLRYLLAPTKGKSSDTPFKLWMWGFDRWGGGASSDRLMIEWTARYSPGYDFAGDTKLVELFHDLRITKGLRPGHNYDGPRLSLMIRDGKSIIIMAWVQEDTLKTGYKISEEWKLDLPKPLAAEKEYRFSLDLALNTAPKPKDPLRVQEREIDANGAIVLKIDGNALFEKKTLRLRANDRAWTSFVFGGPTDSPNARTKAQWIDLSGLAIGSPK